MQNDMHCYREFAYAFNLKVKAAQRVLNYQWGKDLNELDAAIPLMEQSLDHYRKLVALTDSTYYYANSMQTAQRRIPIGGEMCIRDSTNIYDFVELFRNVLVADGYGVKLA